MQLNSKGKIKFLLSNGAKYCVVILASLHLKFAEVAGPHVNLYIFNVVTVVSTSP